MPALQKATNRQTRLINQRLVLRTIFDDSPISRAEIARRTGLTRTTISDVVEGLLESGLTEEIGPGQSTGGKAPILLRVPDEARHLIGIEVGDSLLTGAIVNLRGEIRGRVELPLDGRDGDQALARLDTLIEKLLKSPRQPMLGIGIGTPGLIDTASGTVRWAVNLDWRDLALGERLRQRWQLPVYVANDSHAAALGEHTFGGHEPSESMVVVKVGRGIGAGLVLNGHLYQGEGSGAGEIGHSAIADNYRPCRCGSVGCLETLASTRAVVLRARELAPHAPESMLHRSSTTDGIDLADVKHAFEAGDDLAREVVLDGARHLGRTIGSLIGTLSVRHVVLVGEMTRFGDPWLTAVRREAHRSALALLADATRIEVGRLGSDLVLLGAAALLMTRELGLAPAR
ncbi:MAG: ROK family transcriptional regulator [Candidatus Limnocylindria bacterium]